VTQETFSIELVRPGEPLPTVELENFAAQSDERLIAPLTPRERRARAVSFVFAAIGAVLIHATVVAVLLTHVGFKPAAPPQEAIPVEIITEPPPPPPAPPQQQPPQTLDMDPATDAPQAHQKDENQRDAPQQTASVPTPAQAKDPTPPPPPPAAAPPETKEKDADEPAAPTPAPTPDGSAATPAPQTEANAASALPMILSMPAFDPAPTYSLPAASPFESIFVGKAKATYLSAVFARIAPHMHAPDTDAETHSHAQGEIDFTVDGRGRLIRLTLIRSVGDSSYDQAAIEAIRAGAPYDPPPGHGPMDMEYDYSIP
jgi:protein TonB